MKSCVLAICDLEASYAYKLMEYMNMKKTVPFLVQAFSSAESLCKYGNENSIEALLISSRAMSDLVRALDIGKIMILTEGEVLQEFAEYPTVYKYQSSDNIVSEVMCCYAEEEESPVSMAGYKKKMDLIGIYSPVRRCLKTSFALTLGQILAKDKRVLYLNGEDYSGFSSLLNKSYKSDLSDLMYFVKQGRGNIISKLNSMIQTLFNLDYIPPAVSPADLRNITFENWSILLDEVMKSSMYEVILLDIGDNVDELFQLLRRCGKVFMPVREDVISIAKLEQFNGLLQLLDYEDLKEKICRLKLPFHSSFGTTEYYVDQLVWGELGDYVRELIRRERL